MLINQTNSARSPPQNLRNYEWVSQRSKSHIKKKKFIDTIQNRNETGLNGYFDKFVLKQGIDVQENFLENFSEGQDAGSNGRA